MLAEIADLVRGQMFFGALQWGRELLLAEIPPASLPVPALAPLQWGRELLLAEMSSPSLDIPAGL